MTDTDTPTECLVELRLEEAVALCTAWVDSVARARGIRLLILKGDTLARQGLREPRRSSDVDVLIEPDRYTDAITLLTDAGWEEFTNSFASVQLGAHSTTLRRPGWPNSIDVHSRWPGFLVPAEDAFDVLWNRRTSLGFAHQYCAVPDRMAHLLMLALHSLRGSADQTRHQRELDGILRLELDDNERAEIAAVAEQTMCIAPLRDVLPKLGIDVPVSELELGSVAYRQWHRQMLEGRRPGRVASWLVELTRVPWRQKPSILRHGLWPTDRDLLMEHTDVPDRLGAKTWARFTRLGRGIARSPDVIAELWRPRL